MAWEEPFAETDPVLPFWREAPIREGMTAPGGVPFASVIAEQRAGVRAAPLAVPAPIGANAGP